MTQERNRVKFLQDAAQGGGRDYRRGEGVEVTRGGSETIRTAARERR